MTWQSLRMTNTVPSRNGKLAEKEKFLFIADDFFGYLFAC
jgi:hypothetical protein